jgi:predicted nucleic acid-binding protein
LVGVADVLKPLYARILLPQTVARELQGTGTPEVVRDWIGRPPDWCEIRPDPPCDPTLQYLDPGESAANTLALTVDADRLLIDEWEGRAEAERRHLYVTGTLGILAEAHQRHLLDFEAVLVRLRQTNFYLTEKLVDRVRRRLSAGQ